MIIVHTVLENFWKSYSDKENYGDVAIKKDGFIHCSTFDTVLDMADSHFKNSGQILLICIDTDRVISDVKWEDLKNCGIKFPHIYGLINMSSILGVFNFNKDSGGNYYLPKEIDAYK